MKSSTGVHYVALDHVRMLAALLVFVWHFTHSAQGYPVLFEFVPSLFPLAILDEGHNGVALFMTLSGYLFCKLLDGKKIRFGAFVWNRVLRLLPLLAVVVLLVAAEKMLLGIPLTGYTSLILTGFVLPTLPNGGWSITTEFHFYLLIPLFLWLFRRSMAFTLLLLFVAVMLRLFLYAQRGEVQTFAYFTLVGRIDQFAMGLVAYKMRRHLAGRHLLALIALIAFAVFYWLFDSWGGFYGMPSFPSPSPLWVIMPTIEGAAFGLGVAWYDNSFKPCPAGLSGFFGRLGEYSYSIYLLHYFVVFRAAHIIHTRVMDISNFYVACLWALVLFLLMMPLWHLSFKYIEKPFLKLRRRYIVQGEPEVQAVTGGGKLAPSGIEV